TGAASGALEARADTRDRARVLTPASLLDLRLDRASASGGEGYLRITSLHANLLRSGRLI
ncbi:MAG TPA: hypothetical protein VJR89_15720, partial [Polyangiales bacterium]|nr:hypothetical protein [Polyangiales bacterium]